MTQYTGTHRMTAIVLRGSLILSFVLTILFIFRGITHHSSLLTFELFGISLITAFVYGEILRMRNHYSQAAILLVSIYFCFSVLAMLLYGISAPLGILAASFVVFLSGTLLGTQSIKWIVATVCLALVLIQSLHTYSIVTPQISELATRSDMFHVIAYSTIIGIFALISWLSGKETERSFLRASHAEEKLLLEKEQLANKLAIESKNLHDAKLRETVRLYKFAEIGQSTTATLHELSNLLSELTLDINDIGHHSQHSKAISNAEEGIRRINRLVRQTRTRLNEGREKRPFNALVVLRQTLSDIETKCRSDTCQFTYDIPYESVFMIKGDPLSLSHVITVILNNSFDACSTEPGAVIAATVRIAKDLLSITISDNGPGIPPEKITSLFKPHQSTKPHGLGIGLYVTKHIIKYQLGGKLQYVPCSSGACFEIELPRYTQ
jgi:C4-dicarboxylate-specific signal transduction histidine kinase